MKRLLILKVDLEPNPEADQHLEAALDLLADSLADQFIAAAKSELKTQPEPAFTPQTHQAHQMEPGWRTP